MAKDAWGTPNHQHLEIQGELGTIWFSTGSAMALRLLRGESGTLSLEKAKDMSYFLQPGQPRVSDIECHLKNIKEKRPERQQFQNYVIWGKRIWTARSRQESAAYGQINGIARSGLRSGQSS